MRKGGKSEIQCRSSSFYLRNGNLSPAGKFLTIFPDFLNPRNPPSYKTVKTKTSSPLLRRQNEIMATPNELTSPSSFYGNITRLITLSQPLCEAGSCVLCLVSGALLSDGLFELFEDGPGLRHPIARRALPVELCVLGDLFFDFFARHKHCRVVLIA